MRNKYQNLLIEWCNSLLDHQITEKESPYYGGFRCDSCDFVHGRADNAVYPFLCAYSLTGEEKYLEGAERLLSFRESLSEPSGAVHNDFSSEWRGITAFSAINLLKCVLYYGSRVPSPLMKKIERAAMLSAQWVHKNMVIGFSANINYYCAAALVNALYYALYHDAEYLKSARELLSYALSLFTENGFLSGEAQPHGGRSEGGCLPIDIGYIVEESLPCLIHTAKILEDDKALSFLAENFKKLLDFMLPDGGWDNSFGVRNNKWTYYGSRTSDGCIGAFAELSDKDELFGEAAERTYQVLYSCTHHGKLYGGMQYYENGQKACVHHTFCHAAALADAVVAGIKEPSFRRAFPQEEKAVGYKFYPEINTYKIRAGRYFATVTGYDFATYTYGNGAAHAGGGTLSLLYKQGEGVLIAGSVFEYKRTEQNNMQFPEGEMRHATLLPRAEYEKDGKKYATCLDKSPEIVIGEEDGAVTALVRAKFFSSKTQSPEDKSLVAEFHYRFSPQGVRIFVKGGSPNLTFILPVVKGEVLTDNQYRKEEIFFLTGGFRAQEYAFPLESDVTVTIK